MCLLDTKDVYFDDDFWADHDEDCHGTYESFEDDEDFAEGFIWQCCEMRGDEGPCKRTRHKAKLNQVVKTPRSKIDFLLNPPTTSTPVGTSTKRKAEEDLQRELPALVGPSSTFSA
jgi:hypothetical protein